MNSDKFYESQTWNVEIERRKLKEREVIIYLMM